MTKRLLLAVCSVAALAVASPVTHAASRPQTTQARLAHLIQTSRFSVQHRISLHRRDASHSRRLESVTKSPPKQDAALLALSDSVFAPAVPVQQYTGIEDNATADGNTFREFHSTTYTALGRVSGYYERADWQPAGSTDSAIFRYQGSIFSSTAAAQKAWQDGRDYTATQASATPQDCTSATVITCAYFNLQSTSTPTEDLTYFDLVYNQCLVETSIDTPDTFLNAHKDQIAQTGAAVLTAAVAVAQAACGTNPAPKPGVTPTASSISFNIVGLAVHKKAKVASPTAHSLKTVKAGKSVYLYIYVNVDSAPTTAHVADTFTLARNGSQLFTRSYPHSLLSAPPSAFYGYLKVKVAKAGNYTFTGRITIEDQVQQGSVSFKVLK